MSTKESYPCTFHPDYMAVGRCFKCKRPFCKVCLEHTEKYPREICIECLTHKDLARRGDLRRILPLYIAGLFAGIAIIVNGLQSQYPPILQMLLMPELSPIILSLWYAVGRTPTEIVYFAIVAMSSFAAFTAIEFKNTRNFRRKMLEHGFCPSCGKVLFGNTVCPNCGQKLHEKPPDYPDIEWLRDYLRMAKRKAVSPELLKEKERELRSKYRKKKAAKKPPS
ncbi:MAG: hypothetical protein QXX87_03255 [Candidatus Jordarchaeales archaeon]